MVIAASITLSACAGHVERDASQARIGPRVPAATPIADRFSGGRLALLREINADRREAGAGAIGLDSVATVVAQVHADEMAASDFFSHYGTDGGTPYVRMAESGSDAHVRENIFRRQVSSVDPYQRADPWLEFDVREAEQWLMASTGHRETIIDPHRTGVGIGIAVNRERGTVVVVQAFIAEYADLDVPRHAWHRAAVPIRGRMLEPGLRPLAIVLHREPAMRPWQRRNASPPVGPYRDGEGPGDLVPPWSLEWRRAGRRFAVTLPPGRLSEPGRYYGVVYVAPDRIVERASDRREVSTTLGEPGAAFLIDVF